VEEGLVGVVCTFFCLLYVHKFTKYGCLQLNMMTACYKHYKIMKQ